MYAFVILNSNTGSKLEGSSTFWEIPCVDLDKWFDLFVLLSDNVSLSKNWFKKCS